MYATLSAWIFQIHHASDAGFSWNYFHRRSWSHGGKEIGDGRMKWLLFLFLQMEHAFQRLIAGGEVIIDAYNQNIIARY